MIGNPQMMNRTMMALGVWCRMLLAVSAAGGSPGEDVSQGIADLTAKGRKGMPEIPDLTR